MADGGARTQLGFHLPDITAVSRLRAGEIVVDLFAGGGGASKALEGALGLGQGALDHERAVLADHGNMSGPTVFYVLERALRAGLPSRAVLTSLGPGFTASTATLAAA